MKSAIKLISKELQSLDQGDSQAQQLKRKGNSLYVNGQVMLLSSSKNRFEFEVDDEFKDYQITVMVTDSVEWTCGCKAKGPCEHSVASLYRLLEEQTRAEATRPESGKAYSREGMIKRVILERRQRSMEANYQLESGPSIYGEHILDNEKGARYNILLHNLDKETGYCSCSDYQTNKLGTCKHLMFVYRQIKETRVLKKLSPEFPFVDIFPDPLNDYKPAWFYEGALPAAAIGVLKKYFDEKRQIQMDSPEVFLGFAQECMNIKQIRLRPLVQPFSRNSFSGLKGAW